MRIGSRPSRLAFQILVHLARAGAERPLRARELSAAADVAGSTAARILHALARGGVLTVRHGPGGGYLLRTRPHELTLERIRSALGEGAPLPGCLRGGDRCQGRAPCPLLGPWSRVREAVEGFFRTTTLADLAGLPGGGPAARVDREGGGALSYAKLRN